MAVGPHWSMLKKGAAYKAFHTLRPYTAQAPRSNIPFSVTHARIRNSLLSIKIDKPLIGRNPVTFEQYILQGDN